MKKQTKAPALEKGLLIIEFLSTATEFLTLTQIAQGIGFKISEIQRMVEQLHCSGYLLRDASGAYYLSNKLFTIVNKNSPHKHLLKFSIEPMEKFTQQTGETVHISVIAGSYIRIIGQIEGTGHSRITTRLGLIPAHLTASGLILLAYKEYFEFKNLSLDDQEILKLKSTLKKIRKSSYISCGSCFTRGVRDIAVPVEIENIGVIASLATPFLLNRNNKKLKEFEMEYVAELTKCAKLISNRYKAD